MHPTRLILATGILSVIAPVLSRGAVVGSYTFGPNGSTPSVYTPTTVDPNAVASSISADAGLVLDNTNPATQPTTTPYLRTTFVAVENTEAASVASNSDFKFTITANSGFLLDLASLTFDAMKGGASSNRGFSVRSSVDNFATSLLSVTDIATVRPTLSSFNIDLTGASFQNLSAITFKVYSISPATGSSVDYDSFVVNGLVAPTGVVPNGYQWTGTTNNLWNTTDVNWTGSGTTSVPNGQYAEGVDTIFGDGATNTNPISVTAAVHPNSMLLSNTTVTGYTFTGSPIIVTAAVTKSANGTVTVNNSLTAASIAINSGTFTIGAGGAVTTPSLSVSLGATFNLSTGATLDPATNLTVAANAILNVPTQTLAALNGDINGTLTLNGTALNISGTSAYGGKITGSGSVTKNTNGVLTLGGAASDFTGGLTVSGPGAVILAGANPGGTQPVTATANGKLLIGGAVNSNVVLNAATLGSSGAQTLAGTVTINSASTLDAFNPVTNAAGDLNLNGQLIAPTNPNITINSNNGTAPETAAVRFRGAASTYAGTITVTGPAAKIELQTAAATGSPIGTATVIMPAGPITNNAAGGTFGLVNLRNNSAPAGTIGNTSFGNNFQITGSGFVLMNMLGSAATGSITTLGDLKIGDTQNIAAVSAATTNPAIGLQFTSVHLTGGNATFSAGLTGNTNYVQADNITLGPISEVTPGSGAGIITNGTANVILAGVNTYTGPTMVQTSTLVLASGASIASSSAVTVAVGAKIDATALAAMSVPATQTLVVSGTLDTDVGGITPGTINLSGTLSGSGDGFSNGFVKATVIAASGSTVSPGVSGPGLLSGQNIDLQTGSNFVVDLSKSTAGSPPIVGTDYDQLTTLDYSGGVIPAVHLAGNLVLNVGTGLAQGDSFLIISDQGFDSIAGNFNNLPEGRVFSSGGQFFQISYVANDGNDVALTVVPEPTTALLLLGASVPIALRRRHRRQGA